MLDEIGLDEDGKKIDVLIGALLMQNWGIVLVPEKEELDMSHYPKEFVEFWRYQIFQRSNYKTIHQENSTA